MRGLFYREGVGCGVAILAKLERSFPDFSAELLKYNGQLLPWPESPERAGSD